MAKQIKESIRMCRGHKSPLLNCIGEKKESDFYACWSDFTDGKSSYCKTCCDNIFKYYIDNGCSEKMALYYTLAKIDQPFIKEVYEIVLQKKNKVGNLVGVNISSYLTELHKSSIKKEIWKDNSCTDVMNITELDTKVVTLEEKKERLIELEKIWGKQEEFEDYEFLEENFQRYTKDKEEMSSTQVDLYRDLVRDRLALRKINDKRYDGDEDISKVQARISKLMSTLKIDQFEVEKPKTLSEQTLFNKCVVLELVKPEEVYKNPQKYEDFNKRKKYYKDLVLRPTLNTLCDRKDFDLNIEDLEAYSLNE